jgi:Tol biopolymer transport system component
VSHDRWTVCATTRRVSVRSNGAQVTGGHSGSQSSSSNGRYVAFESRATNLVAKDTNARTDIFVHDRTKKNTRRVSVRSNGNQATGGSSGYPSISADGRYVAFASYATNLVSSDSNGAADIFRHDRKTKKTKRVSIRSNGAQATGGGSSDPSISDDGRYVAFVSYATNLVANDTNGVEDVFRRGPLG